MREIFEFLISVRDAEKMHFPLELGKPAGLWISVSATPGDKVFELLPKYAEEWARLGNFGPFLLGGSKCRRLYKPAELKTAELFRLATAGLDSEAASDQSVYDLSTSCKICGAGRRQISDLLIDCTRLPQSRSIVHTIGREWLFRVELAQELMNHDFSGCKFRPVIHKRDCSDMPIDLQKYPTGREILEIAKARGGLPLSGLEIEYPDLWPTLKAEHEAVIQRAESRSRFSGKPSQQWVQLEITSKPVRTCEPTEFGSFYFDREPRRRCPLGHTGGAALLSEVWIERRDWDGSDIVCTANLYGFQSGYFVPEPALLVSPRLYKFLKHNRIKGATFEVAHLKG